MKVPTQEVIVFEDRFVVPLEIAFVFLYIKTLLNLLNYINILRIIFKIIFQLYQKVFKNIIVLRLLNALMH